MTTLTLGRRENESVVLTTPDGRPLIITVKKIDGKRVRLSFQADASVRIRRGEKKEEYKSG